MGTGFTISKSIMHSLLKYEAVNQRICALRLRGKFFNISIISVHAPIEDADEETKDSFYDTLGRTYEAMPSHDVKIILGDFNAKVGKEEFFRPTIGAHSKHEETNATSAIRECCQEGFGMSRNIRISVFCF